MPLPELLRQHVAVFLKTAGERYERLPDGSIRLPLVLPEEPERKKRRRAGTSTTPKE